MNATKKRTLEQLKTLQIYNSTPKAESVDPDFIMEMIRRIPNDTDLGVAIRNYFNSLKNARIMFGMIVYLIKYSMLSG